MLKRFILTIIFITHMQGCTSISDATESAALLIVAVPIGIVTSPIWVPRSIYDSNTSQIKSGASIEDVKIILGDPLATYTCDDELTLLEYNPELIIEGGRYLIFNNESKYFNTTDNPIGCQPNKPLNPDTAKSAAPVS